MTPPDDHAAGDPPPDPANWFPALGEWHIDGEPLVQPTPAPTDSQTDGATSKAGNAVAENDEEAVDEADCPAVDDDGVPMTKLLPPGAMVPAAPAAPVQLLLAFPD